MVNCHPKVNLFFFSIYVFLGAIWSFNKKKLKKKRKENPMTHAKKACVRDSIAFELHVWWHTEVNNEFP
jgi:hypothetical protein